VGIPCRLYHGDCLALLPSMDRVDLVFTSPPYEDARTYGIGFSHAGDAYVNWAADRFMACLRQCDGLVAWVVQGRTRRYEWSAMPARLMVELRNRGAILRNPAIYRRCGIPGSGGADWLRGDYEWIICATATRCRLPWSDNTACGHPPKCRSGKRMTNRRGDGARGNQNFRAPALANPGNVIDCGAGGHPGDCLAHENEAPFPEKLAEFFVKSFCPPGGVVLDPFVGSGTTGVSALRHGRRFVGIDIRESQIELTTKRLQARGLPHSRAEPAFAPQEPCGT